MQDGKGLIAERPVRRQLWNKGWLAFGKKFRASGKVFGRLALADSAEHDEGSDQPRGAPGWRKFHAVCAGLPRDTA